MGYFNFHFLKKLLSNRKTRKIILFIILFLIILFLKNVCFASIDFEYNNQTNSMPDFPPSYDYKYKFLINSTPNYYYNYITSDSPITFRYDSYNNHLYVLSNSTIYVSSNVHRVSTSFPSGVVWTAYNTNSYYFTTSRFAWSNFLASYKDNNGNDVILYTPPESYENLPHILNDIESLSIGGQSVIIQPGDFPNTKEIRFAVQEKTVTDDGNGGEIITYNNLFLLSLNNQSNFYVDVGNTGVGFYYSIPWSFLSGYLELTKTYNYVLAYDINGVTQTSEIECIYGGKTVEDAIYNQGQTQNNLINEQIDAINNQTDAINNQTDAINNQTQEIQQTTDAVNDVNNSINNSSIDTSSNDLPSISVDDPTQNGINNIFQLMYNAFCVGDPQDIVFPFPYTDKQIVLPVNYLYTNLQNSGSSWITSFIQAFWGYLFAGYVIYDITEKMNKIKEGNIEELEKTNIKEDML